MIAERLPAGGMPARLLALLPLLVLAALVLGGLVAPQAAEAWRARAALAEQRSALAQMRSRIERPAAAAIAAETASALAALAHTAPSATQAVAMVQGNVLAIIARSGARIETVQAGPGASGLGAGALPLASVALRVRLMAELGQLQQLLYALEAARPLLMVTGAVMQPRLSPETREATVVSVQLDIVAPVRLGEAP
jgi:hypothetical protein